MAGARDDLSPELTGIVARAEKVFACPAPRDLGVCTSCCMDPGLEREILATPVPEITQAQLSEWYSAAFSDGFGWGVLCWLMPAILRHLARGEGEAFFYGPEVAFQRCAQSAVWPDWPPPQRTLFAEFAGAYLDARLDQPLPELDVTFCLFSHAGLPMAVLLDTLDVAPLPRLARALVADFGWAMPQIGANAFWSDPAAARAVMDWFSRAALFDRLLEAGVAAEGAEAEVLLKAADLLYPITRAREA